MKNITGDYIEVLDRLANNIGSLTDYTPASSQLDSDIFQFQAMVRALKLEKYKIMDMLSQENS